MLSRNVPDVNLTTLQFHTLYRHLTGENKRPQ